MRRGGLALLLGMEPDIRVIAQVGTADAVVDSVLTYCPDVALLELDLPGGSGLDVAAELRDQAPDCRVLILAPFARPGCLRRALDAGAAGFLVKDGPVDELASAIRRVLTGETVVDPALAGSGNSPLTARECEVLGASAGGGDVPEIAHLLGLPESAVRNHLSSAMVKTGTADHVAALRVAQEQGWLQQQPPQPAA